MHPTRPWQAKLFDAVSIILLGLWYYRTRSRKRFRRHKCGNKSSKLPLLGSEILFQCNEMYASNACSSWYYRRPGP